MTAKSIFIIIILFISLGLLITNSCNENSTEPEDYVDEQIRPFAGTWNVISWLFKEIVTDTLSIPDSSDFIIDCDYTMSLKVDLSGKLTFTAGMGASQSSIPGKVTKKDDDELIITIGNVPDTVHYYFSEDSSTFTYTTISLLNFSEQHRCNLLSYLTQNQPDPVLTTLKAVLEKEQ